MAAPLTPIAMAAEVETVLVSTSTAGVKRKNVANDPIGINRHPNKYLKTHTESGSNMDSQAEGWFILSFGLSGNQ